MWCAYNYIYMIIFDSSPLIHLTKIGKLKFILDLFIKAYIPEAVYEEVVIDGIKHGFSDGFIVETYINKKKIIMKKISEKKPDLEKYLHKGEYEAILLAENNDSLLVIDEKKGKLIAEQYNISTITTAGLLFLIFKKQIININLYESNFSMYVANGWLSINVYHEYLKKARKIEEEKEK